jgi:nucleoside-diphosphate kinase
MIKPVTASLHADAVLAIVAAHGFEVVGELRTTLSLAQAQLFYEEHRGKEFFGPLTAYMSSGPIVGLHLRRAGAVAGWRHLIGPTNLEKAQNERPDSIRAKFGIDKTRNAVHGSDSQGSAMREISFFFSFGSSSATSPVASAAIVSPPSPSKSNTITLSPVKIPPGKARSPYTKKVHTLPSISISRKDIPVMQEYASYEVDPVMRSLLERVMVSRPSDVAAFAIAELNGDQNRKK